MASNENVALSYPIQKNLQTRKKLLGGHGFVLIEFQNICEVKSSLFLEYSYNLHSVLALAHHYDRDI